MVAERQRPDPTRDEPCKTRQSARQLANPMRKMRTLRQSSLRRAIALQREVSTVAESLDVFRKTVEAQLRSQDQRLVSLVSAMQRGTERINELKGQLLEPLFRKLISLALSSTSVDFARVIAMIDEMVTLPKAEQGEVTTARRRTTSRVLTRRRTRTRFRLVRSMATRTRSMTATISCPTLTVALRPRRSPSQSSTRACRTQCCKREFRSTSLKRSLTSLFRK